MNFKLAALQARMSAARYFAPLLLICGCVVVTVRNSFWVGIWPESGAALTTSAFFMTVLAAGGCAWVSSRYELHDLRQRDAESSLMPFRLEVSRFGAALAWVSAAYLAVGVLVFSRTALAYFSAGVGSFIGYAALGYMLVLLATCWGWLVGRLLTPIFAGIGSMLSWYVFQSVIGLPNNAAPISGPPWLQLNWSTIAIRATFVIIFAVSVCAIKSSKRCRGLLRSYAAAFGALLVVCVGFMSTPVFSPRASSSAAIVCLTGKIEYCVWPEHAKYLPMLSEVDSRVAALPVDIPLPPKIVDYALSGAFVQQADGSAIAQDGEFAPEFDISEGNIWALARGVAQAIVAEIESPCGVSSPVDPELGADQLLAWLEARLAGGGTPDYTTNAPIELQDAWAKGRAATELGDAEQAKWAQNLIAVQYGQYCSS